MHKSMKKWRVPLLLALALLIAGIVAITTLTGSADEPEIQQFGVQAYSALDLAGNESTDLRFVCSIGSLDYTEVGFVFSKTDSTPTIGAEGCRNKATTTVFSSIVDDGINVPAEENRWWVAVKLTNIPHSYFDSPLYVRAYVTDGEGTRYSDVETATVCLAKGHKHEVSGDVVESRLYVTGHCDGCNLDDVCDYSVIEPEYKKFISGGGSNSWMESRQISTVLNGGHFYPHESNDNKGNDLYVEYSVLWNETLLNLMPRYTTGGKNYDAVVLTAFADTEYGYGNYKSLGYWSLTDNVPGSGSRIAGAFEYPNPLISTWVSGAHMENDNDNTANPKANYDWYPNVGGTDKDNPEWGWHRIGIVYHEEVLNLEKVKTNEETAEYYLTVTLYIDGNVVSVLSGETLASNNNGTGNSYKLYTVEYNTNYPDNLKYTDINTSYYIYLFALRTLKADPEKGDAFFIDGDAFVSAGHSFVQTVKRVDNPASNEDVEIEGRSFAAPFYYEVICPHVHVWDWDGALQPKKAATLLENGTKIAHCKICNVAFASHEVTDEDATFTPEIETWTNSSQNVSYPTSKTNVGNNYPNNFDVQYDLGRNVCYPTEAYPDGNDLLVEYSILWNPTLLNLATGTGSANAPYVGTSITGSNEVLNNIVYWSPRDEMGYSACKIAGGFEYGALTESEDPVNPYPNMAELNPAADGHTYSNFPNIGGEDEDNPEWGWHRVQIRLHQEVTNLQALENYRTGQGNKPAATYKLTCSIYIDGVLVSVLSTANVSNNSGYRVDNLLYTAESDGNGGVTYGAMGNRILNAVCVNTTKVQSGKTVYFSVADVYATFGRDFVQPVQKVKNPANATISLGETDYSAKVYFASVDAPAVNVLTPSTEGSFGVKKNIVYDILKGEHFYPDESNGGLGNDLYVEYSVLWSSDLVNKMRTDATYRPYVDARIGAYDGSGENKICFWTLTNNNNSADCKFAGGFEYAGGMQHSEDGNPYPRMVGSVNPDKVANYYTAYPNVGGANRGDDIMQENNRYGWHRIGMQLHQEVTNLAAVKGGTTAQYKVTCRLYIDGKLVSILSNGDTQWTSNLLYTAESDGNGGVTYTDIGGDRWLYIFRLNSTTTVDGETVEFAYKDCYATAGHSFVQKVSQLDSPINGHYYTFGTHKHDCDSYEIIKEATLLNVGIRRGLGICKICGASATMEEYEYVPYFRKFVNDKAQALGDRKYLSEIQGDDHFYPDASNNNEGNDLLIEYSVLWNPTFQNFAKGTSTETSPFVTTKIGRYDGATGMNNLVYWSLRDQCWDAWCKFAGGFEAAHATSIYENDTITPPGMTNGTGTKVYNDFPNIGGSTQAKYDDLNNGHEWGWHRIQVRMHQEVLTEADQIIAGTNPEYRVTVTTYIDGSVISELYKQGTAAEMFNQEDGAGCNLLYTVKVNDAGNGIEYSDNAYLTGSESVKRTVWAYKLNYTRTSSGDAYWGEAEVYYTCGHDFVQNVTKVTNPVERTITLDNNGTPENTNDDVTCSGKIWYALANGN